jgi:hypothetical protein
MPQNQKPSTLANPKRFRTIQDLTKLRPDCGASIDDTLVIDSEFLLIIDMTQVGNLLNPYNSPSASYVRTHGVIVHSYTRNATCPVLWSDPYLLIPTSCHLNKDSGVSEKIGEIVGRVSCPSGTFLLLPIRPDLPAPFKGIVDEALEKETGVKIKLPNGAYRVFCEQFEVPEDSKKEHYQNIAVQRQ